MKKILSIILTFAIMLAVLPFGLFTIPTFAEETATSGITGDCTWTLDGTVLTISGNGEMEDYDFNGPWGTSITEVIIEEGVTNISDSAFSECEKLMSVRMPTTVTSIGWFAFSNCESLTDITIPNNVVNIGGAAFYNCSSLVSINIPTSVTIIREMAFSGCSSLAEVHITDILAWCNITFASGMGFTSNPLCIAKNLYLNGKLVTEFVIPDGITEIKDLVFCNCTSLTSISIPDSVTSIGEYAFYGCTGLTEVHITDLKAWCNIAFKNENPLKYAHNLYLDGNLVTEVTIPEGTTQIGDYTFQGFASLKSITIPNSVTSMGRYAFEGCTGIIDITIPESVTSIGYGAFCNCIGLTSISIPDSVTYIDGWTFSNCNSLANVVIPDSVTSIGSYAFEDCDSLESVQIGSGVTSIGEGAFGWNGNLSGVYITDIAAWCNISFDDVGSNPLYSAKNLYLDGEKVTNLVIPDSVTRIGSYAFYGGASIENFSIPDSVINIGNVALDGTAWYNNQPEGLVYAGRVAYKYKGTCPATVEIKSGTISIAANAFSGCYNLCDIILPESLLSIDKGAFSGCGHIESITIPDSVIDIGDEAFYNSGIKNLTLGANVTNIGEQAFSYSALETVTISDSVTSVLSSAFEECSNLTAVYITDLSAWCNISFANNTSNPLYYAKNLYLDGEKVTNLVIPTGVMGIGDYAFYGCADISSITIPESVTSVGNDAFYGTAWYNNQPEGVVYAGKIAYKYKGTCPTIVEINEGTIGIANSAFLYCSELENIILPESLVSIGAYAFESCFYLDNIVIPDKVSFIGNGAFYGCSRLQNIVLPKGMTSISDMAFLCCYSLTSITIPENITNIGNRAFYECDLQDVYYLGSENDKFKITIGEMNESLLNAAWHYDSCIDSVEHNYSDDNICIICGHIAEIPGDLDGVEGVTDRDAVHLLYHTFLPDIYPVNQACDFNGDGEVNDKDAVHLLYYTFLPDLYPLA